MRRKVLIVGAGSGIGGVAGYVRTYIAGIADESAEIHVAVPVGGRDHSLPLFPGAQIHPMAASYSIGQLPSEVIRLHRMITSLKVDVIHLHTLRAGWLGVLAAMGRGLPIVYTGHGWRFDHKPRLVAKSFFWLIDRLVCSASATVTVISAFDRLRAIDAGLVHPVDILHCRTQIDPSRFPKFRPLPDAKKLNLKCVLIANSGSLDDRKDPITFVQTAALVARALPLARFMWIGDGPLRGEVEAEVSLHGLNEKFTITGVLDPAEIPSRLGLVDIFLFTSKIEGVPLVILEAMAAGASVVSSEYPGVQEIIRDAHNGFLFPVGNASAAAGAVMLAVEDRLAACSIPAQARDFVATFHCDPQYMSQFYLSIYKCSVPIV